MRRQTAQRFPRPIATAITAQRKIQHQRVALIGLVGITLALLLAARTLSAEPAAFPDQSMPQVSSAPPAAVNTPTDGWIDAPADALMASDEANTKQQTELRDAARRESWTAMDEILFMHSLRVPKWRPQTTDEVLVAAVAEGTNPDLEPRNPFRKRSRDLFRTERPLTIGNREMLLRLRLRAKARRAMSVELHF